jgi:hypothetical protein
MLRHTILNWALVNAFATRVFRRPRCSMPPTLSRSSCPDRSTRRCPPRKILSVDKCLERAASISIKSEVCSAYLQSGR